MLTLQKTKSPKNIILEIKILKSLHIVNQSHAVPGIIFKIVILFNECPDITAASRQNVFSQRFNIRFMRIVIDDNQFLHYCYIIKCICLIASISFVESFRFPTLRTPSPTAGATSPVFFVPHMIATILNFFFHLLHAIIFYFADIVFVVIFVADETDCFV